ncbi:hypothetical protein HCN44_009583 [Aphidius gifuensis]|uniref:Pleckstrin homology domain-containing family J member 1 n=1 Tax=Aphidius gifuensis TaxID=684658 RepID=A0A834Y4W4_APHGI|nr:pleckstrin homology domain-containing family J member 1-like [Aphidius gifuensis]KAF7998185.1 hypothetical protein HCN44_009583 [Aphidius gifuensis]
MKFNEKELIDASKAAPQLEGRLNYKQAHKSVFKERWFKLMGNLLFYFNINEFGNVEQRQPAGIIILENCKINDDVINDGAFAFSIVFSNDHEKRHILTGRSECQVEQWIGALRQSSYEYWRTKLIMLQERLSIKTGNDPLLMIPRNHGVVRDEAWSHHVSHSSSFRSHIRSFTNTSSTESKIVKKESKSLIEL